MNSKQGREELQAAVPVGEQDEEKAGRVCCGIKEAEGRRTSVRIHLNSEPAAPQFLSNSAVAVGAEAM